MKLGKIIKHYLFGKSLKDMEMDRILDKISKSKNLTDREISFLDLYQHTCDDDLRDFVYLSKNSTFNKISQLLEKNKKVICDLYDKNGKIGLQIVSIENQFDTEKCILTFRNKETYFLHDRFLYNIIYNYKKNEYSLQEQDEYFEKILTKGDED